MECLNLRNFISLCSVDSQTGQCKCRELIPPHELNKKNSSYYLILLQWMALSPKGVKDCSFANVNGLCWGRDYKSINRKSSMQALKMAHTIFLLEMELLTFDSLV